MITPLPKGVQKKQCKFFWLKIFTIWHGCHRWCTFSCEYLRKFSKKFETAVMINTQGLGGNWFMKKNQKSKISWHFPLDTRTQNQNSPPFKQTFWVKHKPWIQTIEYNITLIQLHLEEKNQSLNSQIPSGTKHILRTKHTQRINTHRIKHLQNQSQTESNIPPELNTRTESNTHRIEHPTNQNPTESR